MWAQSCLIWLSLILVCLGQIQSSQIWSVLAGIQTWVLEECFGSLVLKLWPGIIQFHEDHLSVLFIRLACCLQKGRRVCIRNLIDSWILLPWFCVKTFFLSLKLSFLPRLSAKAAFYTVPYLDGQPAQPSCSTSSPDRVSPGRPCSQASSGFLRPTALCSELTAVLGCFAPSLQSSPRSTIKHIVTTFSMEKGSVNHLQIGAMLGPKDGFGGSESLFVLVKIIRHKSLDTIIYSVTQTFISTSSDLA